MPATWTIVPDGPYVVGQRISVSISSVPGGGPDLALTLYAVDGDGHSVPRGTAPGDADATYAFETVIPAGGTPGDAWMLALGESATSGAFTVEDDSDAPVLERISGNLIGILSNIRAEDGSSISLFPRRRSWTGDNPADGLAVLHPIAGVNTTQTSGGSSGIAYWVQTFAIQVWVVREQNDLTPIDSAIIAAYADICAALMADRQRGGNADDTQITGFATFNPDSESLPGFVLTLDVPYSIDESDPTMTVP